MKCDICGVEVKNLGAHKYQKHREELPTVAIDVPKEKPLSDLIDGIKALLRPYQSQISVSYEEENGSVKSIEITARIQTRR